MECVYHRRPESKPCMGLGGYDVASSRPVSATYRLISLKKTGRVSQGDRWDTSALFAFLDSFQSLKFFTTHASCCFSCVLRYKRRHQLCDFLIRKFEFLKRYQLSSFFLLAIVTCKCHGNWRHNSYHPITHPPNRITRPWLRQAWFHIPFWLPSS